ncbi:PCQ3_46 (plasmid) [Streptomyces ambofaciens ATCC 23877]|uniref:PCQ3_46 n=1 Tax=Streptomyces ambofaciens (strain ATCC 23877 / 3486 / DSM 40053 / JCM 4204 / NBRC 12836 / NRRL B-2516) TaxID=278992 RepID=A0A0K2B6J4_STRA7|nr:HK97 gp10 family phage protein [Streptomyces ambofaciens]AKZ60833.1 PCQ3_46 [Streptomyces ambofaciens ATCC 23877]
MNLDDLADRLDAAADELGDTIERRVRRVGSAGVARIRANASGRPGPNVITGQYRASWRAVTSGIPYGAECTIGTNAPQGRRLEFGFVGPDSLGRVYNQPPFPHVQPALGHIEDTLHEQMLAAVGELLA